MCVAAGDPGAACHKLRAAGLIASQDERNRAARTIVHDIGLQTEDARADVTRHTRDSMHIQVCGNSHGAAGELPAADREQRGVQTVVTAIRRCQEGGVRNAAQRHIRRTVR